MGTIVKGADPSRALTEASQIIKTINPNLPNIGLIHQYNQRLHDTLRERNSDVAAQNAAGYHPVSMEGYTPLTMGGATPNYNRSYRDQSYVPLVPDMDPQKIAAAEMMSADNKARIASAAASKYGVPYEQTDATNFPTSVEPDMTPRDEEGNPIAETEGGENTTDVPADTGNAMKDKITRELMSLDDGSLQGAENMLKAFESVFAKYEKADGSLVNQANLFMLQPGRKRETEMYLNPNIGRF